MDTAQKFWEAFQQPPVSCTQSPFWFLNGDVDGKIYASQMDQMAQQGVCQAMPHPRFGMDRREYLTDRYFKAFEQMADNARQKGLLINLYDEYNWSSGPAGGKITEDPANCALGIAMGSALARGQFTYQDWEKGFKGWVRKENILLAGYGKPSVPDSTEGIDMASIHYTDSWKMDGSLFSMPLPEGTWLAFVIYTVRTHHPSVLRQGNGGIIDYLNPAVTDQFLKLTHEQYYRHLKPYFGNTIASIFYDEASPYAGGNFTWTADFETAFEQRCGYCLREKLPLLFFDGGNETAKVRCDYWDTLTERYSEGFVGKLADWCGKHGIALTGHSHEDSALWPIAGDLFRNLRHQQWTGFDSLGGYKPYSALKPAVSVAHMQGSKVVVCEALGVYNGWECSPKDLRRGYNQLAIAGASLLVPHAFFQTVDNPKAECPPSYFTCNPYWKYYREITRMTDRQCVVNRYLQHQADAAVFYPIVSWWAAGREGRGRTFPWGTDPGVMKHTRAQTRAFDAVIDSMMMAQIDSDIFDSAALQQAEVIAGEPYASAHLGTETYRVIVLPPMQTIRLCDIKKLLELAQAGVPMVAAEGFRPTASAENGGSDPALASLTDRLNPYLHFFSRAADIPAGLKELVETDVQVLEGPQCEVSFGDETMRHYPLDTAHRTASGLDIYLLFHTEKDPETFTVSVRCQAPYTALLDAYGQTVRAIIRQTDAGRTELTFTAQDNALYYFVLSQKEIPQREILQSGIPQSEIPLEKNPHEAIPQGDVSQKALSQDEFSQKADPIFLKDRTTESQKILMKLKTFYMKPDTGETITVPVCTTTQQSYESPQGDELAYFWDHWMDPEQSDEDWEVLSLKRGPKLYDHTGSRFFRFEIPQGADGLQMPLPVKGEYALYINGKLIEAVTEFASRKPGWLPVDGCRDHPGILGIECSSMAPQFGLTGAPVFHLQPVCGPLQDWNRLGLGWYSGFCVYETQFEWNGDEKQADVWLDLGDVRECAEVFLNGQSVGQRVWDPYEYDLSGRLRHGTNRLRIGCCNLISNEFSWDPLGTRGSGRRLASGVLGPVRILVLNQVP